MFKSINEVRDARKEISILNGMRVEVLIVLVGAEHTVLLWDEEEGGHLQELRGDDLIFLKILINECFQDLHVLWVEQIVLWSMQNKEIIKFNGMVEKSVRGKKNFGLLEYISKI